VSGVMQKAELKQGAILENKDTIIEYIRNSELDGKALQDVAGKSYLKYLIDQALKQISQDPTLMDNALEMVREKLINNDNEAFRLRFLKLIKPELTNIFKEDMLTLMGNKKIT
jgi:hypothetical protein